MLVLGLTGSVGMGKSTVAAMFKRLGIPVFDADSTVHRLINLPQISAEILAQFPAAATDAGGVDRRKLGAIVFEKPEELRKLERLLHPRVLRLQQRFLSSQRRRCRSLVILDVPLLFESNTDLVCDLVAVVSAGSQVQRTRVLSRPGMTKGKFARMLALQMPDSEKRARADIIIRTNMSKRVTFRQVSVVAHLLMRKSGGG